MPEKIIRLYEGTDAKMLIAIDVIADAAMENEKAIREVRPKWDAGYYKSFKAAIAETAKSVLGANTIAALRKATNELTALQASARKDAALLKVQVEEDFSDDPARRDELLSTLGFDHTYAAVRNNDQEALSTLLYRIAGGLTKETQGALVDKGIGEALLERLKSAARPLTTANAQQEGAKVKRPQLTHDALAELNTRYKEGIGIAKIAAKIFSDNKALKQRFSYGRIIKAMDSYHTGGGDNNSNPPARPGA